MPANLPPDYFVEEKRLRQAKSIDEKIAIIEKMIAIMPHHKGTDKLLASLRAKIARLREEKERRPQTQRKFDQFFNIKKDGAGQVLCIGFPNAGKSALISALSGEPLEVADYPYTTRILHTRMMRYEDIWIQLVDTTAIGDENTPMWFGNMVKKADVILAVLALSDALDIEYELIIEELKRYRPEIVRTGEPFITAVNKLDLIQYSSYLDEFIKNRGKEKNILPVSAEKDVNLHELKEMIFNSLNIARIYSKLPGKKPDLELPFVMKKGGTVLEFAEKIHKDFLVKLRYAKLWRRDSYNGMMVSKDFVLEDKDIVELHI